MDNTAEHMAVKAALVVTTASAGWLYVQRLANRLVMQATQAALDEESPTIGEAKRLKAKALQKGFSDFFQLIESLKQFDPKADVNNDLLGDLEQEPNSI